MISVNSSTQSSSVPSVFTGEAVKTTTASSITGAVNSNGEASKVSISGRAVLLSRLFRTSDPNANPAIEYSTTTSNLSGSVYSYLNSSDRATLATVYEYANANGIDPIKVDNLAFDLGVHRRMQASNGPGGSPDTNGLLFHLDGTPLISEFKPADEAIAQRLLASNAVNDTKIDHGFLQSELNPGRSPTHAVDFNFLQQIVFAFSASGSDGSADPNATPVVRAKKEDFQPIKIPGTQAHDGNAIMLARLFNVVDGSKSSSMANQGDSATKSTLANYLTSNDRAQLSLMYSLAEQRGEDLSKVDKLAMTLSAGRMRESLMFSSLTATLGAITSSHPET